MLRFQYTSCFFYALLFFSAYSCIPDKEEAARISARLLNDKIEVAEGITTYYSDSANLLVILKAPIMKNILDPIDSRKVFPNGLKVTFLNETGDTSSTLTAKHGIYHEQKGRIVVTDSVVWKSMEGQKLETDELIWQEDEERIHTDRFVVITQPDYIIYGHGLDAKQDFSNAQIRQVTGRVPVSHPSDGGNATNSIPPR